MYVLLNGNASKAQARDLGQFELVEATHLPSACAGQTMLSVMPYCAARDPGGVSDRLSEVVDAVALSQMRRCLSMVVATVY